MIKIFTTDKVKTLDQYTIQNEPINSISLIERAATIFMREFTRRIPSRTVSSSLPVPATMAQMPWQ